MKTIQKLALAVGLIGLASTPSVAQYNGLPDTGTYFIVNASSGEALHYPIKSTGFNQMNSTYLLNLQRLRIVPSAT